MMSGEIATLKNNGNSYSVFQVGDIIFKFYTSPYLKKYCSIDHWDNSGYIEYTGLLSTSSEPVEDTIDLAFIAKRLHIPTEVFKGIKEVRII